MKIIRFVIVFIFLYWNATSAKLDILFNENLNYASYPNLALKIKVLKNGNPIEITKNNVLILEDIYPIQPISVSLPDASGYQIINWTSTSPNSNVPKIVVTVGDETENTTPTNIDPHPFYDNIASYIKFVDNDRNIIKEIRFSNVSPGDYTNQRINIVSAIQKSRGSVYYPTRVDWVGTSSNEFKYLWLGSSTNTNSPPVNIISPFLYAIEVLFFPQDNKYKREYLTVSYDNGRQSHIALVANSFPINRRTQLKLLKPESNEILYPCQNYSIQWKGNKLNVPVFVEYTTNKGKVWESISQIFGTNVNWSVPNIETDSLFIRIYQNYSPSTEFAIQTNANQPQKIVFNKDGSRILLASKDGKLTETEIDSKAEIFSIPFANIDFPFVNANITGLSYFNNDTFAIVSYRAEDFYGNQKNDTIVVVNLQQGKIENIFALPEGERLKKFAIDEKKKLLLLVREYQNSIELYSLPDLTFVQRIPFEAPIQDITTRNDLLAVALLSNKIELRSLEDFTKITEINIQYQPIITNLAISNDGRLIAYTTKKEKIKDVIENFSDAYVIDLQSGQIVRSLYNNWSDAIGIDFSPTDNYVIIGFENNPTMVLWDLVNDVRTAEIYGSGYNITDFKVASDNFLIATAEPARNRVVLREFSYPESVVAGPFKIHKPKIQTKEITFPPQKIYYPTLRLLSENFCNVGDVPFIVETTYFTNGKNFALQRQLDGDSIPIGGCLQLPIVYNPKDTGNYIDTLVIVACGEKYFVPLRGRGINRDFRFFSDVIDFGSVCVNEMKELEVELGFNNDTLDLPIDFVRIHPDGQKYFSVVEGNQYQVLNSNQKLKVKLKFQPREIGAFSSFVEIYYLGQWEYVFRIPIKGEGFGVDISISTSDLRFIPEIPTRDITIKNLSATDVMIDSIVFNLPNYFTTSASTPFLLQSNSAKILSFTMVAPPPSDIIVTFHSSPCGVNKNLTLGQYNGNSTVTLPKIETEPKGIITIPIEFQNSENKPYNGRRFFDGEITLHSRMFLPLSIESDFGNATITKNQVVDDTRFIGFRVEGDFPSTGVVAKLTGNVALAETDSTIIAWNAESIFWGKNVQVIPKNGYIKLTGLCGDRRIVVENPFIKDLKISPNPVGNYLDLSATFENDGTYTLQIFDVLGNLVYNENIILKIGVFSRRIPTEKLPKGIYKLVISQGPNAISVQFIKI